MNSKKLTKIKILSLALVVVMTLGAGVLALGSFANEGIAPTSINERGNEQSMVVPSGTQRVEVTDETSLRSAISSTPANGSRHIVVMGNIILTDIRIIINGGRNIYIESNPLSSQTFTMYQNVTSVIDPNHTRHFEISGNSSLSISNIVLSRSVASRGGGIRILNQAQNIFTMYRGAQITNSAPFASVGQNSRAGAVWIQNGNFYMLGGLINGNTAGYGSAVQIYLNGTFTMRAGEISDNTATQSSVQSGNGAISTHGTFRLEGGLITNNRNTTSNAGGIHLGETGRMYMSGGTIRDNTATGGGGGVNVSSNSTFTMTGGAIVDNTAATRGGGVYVRASGATFNMYGGIIGGSTEEDANTAPNGGGVAVSAGTFNMNAGANGTSGTIAGNTATLGGGVFVTGSNSTFTMNAGLIDNNLSTSDASGSCGGGGVRVFGTGSTFIMNDGIISNNISARHGGGVLVASTLAAEFNGGSIIGNTAADLGGGVMLHHATAVMTGGTIGGDGIYDANTSENAAGVMVDSSIFDFEGGSIVGNVSRQSGGGMRIGGSSSRTTTMHDGAEIRGNHAGSSGTGAGGAIDIVGTNMNFVMNGGAITGNTAVSQGGAVRIQNATATMTMNNGIIAGNHAGNHGGGVFVNGGTLTVNGGSFFGNHTNRDGGGIFYAGYPAGYSVPLVATDYLRLTVAASVVFRHNTAGNGAFVPHESATAITRIASRNTSVQWHPLNNFDINFRSDEEYIPRVATIEKELITPEGTPIPNGMTFHFNVDFVSRNGITPADPLWPSVLPVPSVPNVTIPVSGNGTTTNGITTRIMEAGIPMNFQWHATGVYLFRVTELQTLAPHTLSTDENMIFSDAEYILRVYVARCVHSDVLYPRFVFIFDVTDLDGEPNDSHKADEVSFTNIYTVNADDGLTVTKTVTGEFSDPGFLFQFAINVSLDEIFEISTFTGTIRNASGGVVDTVVFENGVTQTIELAHGWNITFVDIPVGTQFSVVETYVPGYVTTIAVTGVAAPINGLETGNQRVQAGGSTAAFTNDFDPTPPTGLIIGAASAGLVVLLAVGAFVGFVVVKAKKARA